jgi:hypothetical protein
MIKIADFTYTKASGEASERTVAMLSEPGANLKGVDVTNMDTDDFARFVVDYKELAIKHKKELMDLLAEHEVTHNFRQFKPSNITNITTQEI